MSNLDLYNAVRQVPDEAKKTIGAGRLKGMTDINPMWRIKVLTEQFGACGEGWKVENVKFENIPADKEIVTICTGTLYYRIEGEWSDGVFGVGGSKIAVSESKGIYIDDEAYKKAYTDMLSVACKSLGIGADVYWDKDKTKYTELSKQEAPKQEMTTEEVNEFMSMIQNKSFMDGKVIDANKMNKRLYASVKYKFVCYKHIKEVAYNYANENKLGLDVVIQSALQPGEKLSDFYSKDKTIEFCKRITG